MRVTVCELANRTEALEADWEQLLEHVSAEASDFVLLPEMPFHPWLAASREVDPARWQAAVEAHTRWEARLGELAPAAVAATRPVVSGGVRYNEGCVWLPGEGCRGVHRKAYLPEEEGFWEASWYARGAREFELERCGELELGFLICTELWFLDRAREYGKQGAHLLLCPRATPAETAEKWVIGGRAAAVVSGAYCLSSNFGGPHEPRWGGRGWVVEPESGAVLGITSPERPFLTVEIDLAAAAAAKRSYPRYVAD